MLNNFHKERIGHVLDVFNPQPDGNCGFRCLARALKNDESKYSDIKTTMLHHLRTEKNSYIMSTFLNEAQFERLERLLEYSGRCVDDPTLWFVDPDCSQLAADTFRTPIEFHSTTSSTLYLPLTKSTRYTNNRPIALNLYRDHIYLVKMKPRVNYGYPTINNMHSSMCTALNILDLSTNYTT
jgi:hypothetical protein